MKRLILAAVALLGLTAAASAQTRLGTEGAYPPYNYVDDSGNVAGFDIDVGNEICKRAAQGDMSGRVLHLKQYGDLAPTLVAFNRLLDLTDAYIRESGACLEHASEGKYYRPFLPQGMVGSFRKGADIINRARESMGQRAKDTAALQEEVSGLVVAAAAGDLKQRIDLNGKDGFMRQLADVEEQAVRQGWSLEQTQREAKLDADAGYEVMSIPFVLKLDRAFVVRRAWEEATGKVQRIPLPEAAP